MSVIIVAKETYQTLAESLFFCITYTQNNYKIKEVTQSLEHPTGYGSWEAMKKEVSKWYLANIQSYNVRYKENVDGHELIFPNTKTRNFSTLCQVLKSLESIHYNIEIEMETKLEAYIKAVKDTIIEELPEYQSAIWG